MDNLILSAVARELSREWEGAVLEDFRQDSESRFRLRFARGECSGALVVSVSAATPWIGRPSRRWDGPRWSPGPLAVAASRRLVGGRVGSIARAAADRSITIKLTSGRGLAIELAPHGGNLVLLDEAGGVEATFRRGRRSADRLATGTRYEPGSVPPGHLDPIVSGADAVDALLETCRRAGESPLEVLRRRVWGIGTVAATLVLEEAETTGETSGVILCRRLGEIADGSAVPLLEAPEPPWEAVARGTFLERRFRLLPWRPHAPATDVELVALDTPAATAGLYHECAEAAERLRARIGALGGILRAESARTFGAERKARGNAEAFEDGDRLGRQAEALLAGLSHAERSGETVSVPDPYDPIGPRVVVAAPPGVSLPRVAEDLFRRQRRARRGAHAARARAEALRARLASLDALRARQDLARSEADVAELESAMRGLGLAIGLARSARAAKAAAATVVPRLAGVRLLTSGDGLTILVGQTGRDNDRLTFKIAAPDDVWLHAAGVPGAHVIIRNPGAGGPLPSATLHEAARLAAWFSGARGSASVDVQWTRRKNVRRARGAAPGTVLVKRCEILRVRPEAPQTLGGDPIDPRDTVP